MMKFTHGSLFSGIGGFDLAAEWMGWENVFHCEWNEFGKKILNYYWPKAISYDDITKTDFSVHRGTIDILTGGFPCQPYSQAGKRKGKDDERHLWPEMLRAIREIQPRWIVGENVFGLINWNGGLVFDEVQTDLEASGYEVFPYVLPACAVNAPHRRDRVWFVAYASGYGQHGSQNRQGNNKGDDGNKAGAVAAIEFEGRGSEATREAFAYASGYGHQPRQFGEGGQTQGTCKAEGVQWQRVWTDVRGNGEKGTITDPGGAGFQKCNPSTLTGQSGFSPRSVIESWRNFPTQSPVCNGNDGIPARLDGITFSKWRNETIKSGGNAVVPQVPYGIFKAIQQYEK